MRWAGNVARMGQKCTRGLVGEHEGGSFEHLSVYDQYQNGCYGTWGSVDWIYLAQDREK